MPVIELTFFVYSSFIVNRANIELQRCSSRVWSREIYLSLLGLCLRFFIAIQI